MIEPLKGSRIVLLDKFIREHRTYTPLTSRKSSLLINTLSEPNKGIRCVYQSLLLSVFRFTLFKCLIEKSNSKFYAEVSGPLTIRPQLLVVIYVGFNTIYVGFKA